MLPYQLRLLRCSCCVPFRLSTRALPPPRRYALTASDVLVSATGGDGELSAAAGFSDTGKFCIYHLGPAGTGELGTRPSVFNWADAGEEACEASNLMQLAAKFPKLAPLYAPTARALIDGFVPVASSDPTGSRASTVRCSSWYEGSMGFDCAASLMAYTPAGTLSQLPELLPLDYLFKRRAVGFLRGSWLDANTSWLGFKACNSTADHGDLDAGPVSITAPPTAPLHNEKKVASVHFYVQPGHGALKHVTMNLRPR